MTLNLQNYKRVALVWMDEYAEYIYKRRPQYRNLDPGDVTAQKALREKLQCKPFKWFMEEIAFDLPKKYPPVEPPDYGHGFIKSSFQPSFCVDASHFGVSKRFVLFQFYHFYQFYIQAQNLRGSPDLFLPLRFLGGWVQRWSKYSFVGL